MEKKKTGFKARANDVCVRPFKMLVEEPMLLAITSVLPASVVSDDLRVAAHSTMTLLPSRIYMSVIYGILYLNFVAYPVSDHDCHGSAPVS